MFRNSNYFCHELKHTTDRKRGGHYLLKRQPGFALCTRMESRRLTEVSMGDITTRPDYKVPLSQVPELKVPVLSPAHPPCRIY